MKCTICQDLTRFFQFGKKFSKFIATCTRRWKILSPVRKIVIVYLNSFAVEGRKKLTKGFGGGKVKNRLQNELIVTQGSIVQQI